MEKDARNRIRTAWSDLAGCPEGFAAAGVQLSIGRHVIAPLGWIGSVALDDSAVVAFHPEESWATEQVSAQELSVSDLHNQDSAEAAFGPIEDTLGPALLAFALSPVEPTRAADGVIGPLPPTDARVRAVAEAATPEEVNESAIEDRSSGLFVALNNDGRPVAASGYSPVLDTLAHIGVLTAADVRGSRFGRRVAAVAIAHAQRADLIPQWRAAITNTASVALAERLGLTALGRQFSFRLTADGPSA